MKFRGKKFTPQKLTCTILYFCRLCLVNFYLSFFRFENGTIVFRRFKLVLIHFTIYEIQKTNFDPLESNMYDIELE